MQKQENLQKTTSDTISEHTRVFRKRFGEQPILLPPLPRFLEKINSERLELASQNKNWLKEHPNLLQLICDYHLNYKYPPVPNADLDTILYVNSFSTPAEDDQCRQFHQADIQTKCALLSKFSNERLTMQAIRLIGRNFSNELSNPEKNIFKNYLENIFSDEEEKNPVDFKNKKHLSPKKALEQIASLKQTPLDNAQLEILQELEEYLTLSFIEDKI